MIENRLDSEQQEACMTAAQNARSLEEILLTADSDCYVSEDDAQDVIDRCEKIIRCMEIIHP